MVAQRISLDEAASLVPSGVMLALGGMTLYRRPVAFVRQLIYQARHRSPIEGLTLLAFTAGFESDLLVGARMVETVRTCYFGFEIFGFAPMFTYYAHQGLLKIVEETEASIAFGLRAQMAGVGFMPSLAWIGTDLPKLRPDVKTVIDPYTGEELTAFPAIEPDIAVLHALRADRDGNVLIGKNKGIDEELALTAKTVIVTTEEIVPELKEADIAAPFVDYLVHTPLGAKPTSCHPLYPVDGSGLLEYVSRVSDPPSFERYLERWLRRCSNEL
ncbi:MAG: malonate decarboxylase subunit alpha [Anaerolineales bacterium]|nr:malonate decarboxylase subunit alpha [Anaerolineales bacterium]MCS7247995.1 malonate decarboxylase subunit alpha [Anaerolineales bacterium]MDW8161807.1 malonate decarboxylase subunit alpha [Anaerolineales bacterium]MDW8446498.1 malonate decarboxylase subunit alpha [Anaerolineales bacterium]